MDGWMRGNNIHSQLLKRDENMIYVGYYLSNDNMYPLKFWSESS